MKRGKREQPRQKKHGLRLLALCPLLVFLTGAAIWGISERNSAGTNPPVSSAAPSEQQPAATPPDTQAPAETAPASETAEPVVTPEPSQPAPATLAEQTLAGMTLREKVYQMFIVYPSAVTGIRTVTAAGETTRKALEKYPVGGFLYDRTNMVSKEQVRTMLTNTQGYARIPMILTCDEEGGRVNRLMGTVGTTYIGPMLGYKDQGADVARSNAQTIAKDLVSCGFNTDLAPVADVWSNPRNTVIGDRAYSDSYEQAAQLIPAAVEGFHAGGVACALKHFPGHGDTSADSHYGSVYVYKPLDEIRQEELLSFQAGIDAGADMVMMGHLIISDVDDQPALFSEKLVTQLLREEMGFQGVVISDGLQMQAMTDHYSSAEIALRSVKAGVDILLCPRDLESAVNALLHAVETGEISEERIDESVLRILTLKENRGILTEVPQ